MIAAGHKLESRDIVDGHRQKTLQLLWTLIFIFEVTAISVPVLSNTILLHMIANFILQWLNAVFALVPVAL